MAVLFLGGNLTSLSNSSGTVFEVSESDGFTRSKLRVSGTGEYADTASWTAVQDIWLHGQFSHGENATYDLIYFMDGSTPVFKVHTAGDGELHFSYLSALDTWTEIDSTTVPDGGGAYDIHVKTGASGEFGFYLGGSARIEVSQAMTYATDITSIRFNKEGAYLQLSQIAVADEPTIGWRVMEGRPTGAGANTAWVGDYTSVDEATLSEADYIYSNTANEVETFAQSLQSALDGYVVRAVAVCARARRGSSGPQNIQLAMRSGGTDYFSPTKSLGLGYTAVSEVWDTNPDTSADWTNSQATAIQPGVKSIA